MVKDAEEHAAEDKTRREEADTRNHAEHLRLSDGEGPRGQLRQGPRRGRRRRQGGHRRRSDRPRGHDSAEVKAAHDDLIEDGTEDRRGDLSAKQAAERPSDDADRVTSDDDVVDAEIVDEDDTK